MTIDAVFHDARKANTEDHRAYSSHVRNESQTLLKLKIKTQKDGFPNLTL